MVLDATGASSDPIIERLIAEDKVPWYRKPNLRVLYLFLVPVCLGVESTSGFDSSMMSGVQSLKHWSSYFGSTNAALLGILVSCYNLGAITALPFVTLVSDHLGRKGSIIAGSLIMIIGSIIQCQAVNVGMWIFARLVLGHGIVYAIVAGATLVGELGHPKERAVLGGLFYAFYNVGSIIAAAITLNTVDIDSDWQWRLPSILQASPSLIQLAFVWFIPESPRWLISKDRGDEALAILIKYHAEGDATNELPHAEYAEIKSALDLENASRRRGWSELFQSAGMRRRSLVGAALGLFTQFSGNSLISNYLTPILVGVGVTESKRQLQINLGLQAWGLVVQITFGLLASRFLRRRIYLICACSLVCVYSAWTAAQATYTQSTDLDPKKPNNAAGIAVITMIFVYSPAYAIGYNALTYTYLVELFPFYVRTKGIAWEQFWGRSAGFFSAQVNPIGLANAGWKYLLVYVCFLCFEVVFIYFLFPETYNRTLEELTFLFETQEERDRITADVEKHLGLRFDADHQVFTKIDEIGETKSSAIQIDDTAARPREL